MMLRTVLLCGLAAVALDVSAAAGQALPPEDEPRTTAGAVAAIPRDPDEIEGVVVEAAPRGGVVGDIKPEITLDEEAIRAYGAANITELLAALEPQTRAAGGGPPVLLINGQRTSGFQEMRGIPSEAIERVEILPEAVALSYGYRAEQRVVNFVLRRGFRSLAVEAETRQSTAGGRSVNQLEGNVFRVVDDERWTFDLEHQRDSALFESERDIVRSASGAPFDRVGNLTGAPFGAELDPALSLRAGVPVILAGVPGRFVGATPTLDELAATAGRANTGDLTADRTLMPSGDRTQIGGAITRGLTKAVTATLSASLEDTNRLSYLGLPGVVMSLPAGGAFSPVAGESLLYRYLDAPGSLSRKVDTLNGQAGLAMIGLIGDWRWTLTGEYNRTETTTRTGRGLDTSALRAAVAAGDPAVNPFGPLPASLTPALAPDIAQSTTSTANAELVLNGALAELPAGGLTSSLKLGLETRSLEGESRRSGVVTTRSLARDRGAFQGSFNLPIASRRREVLSALGELSTNLNLGYQELSDLGGLASLGLGVNWSPVQPLTFLASYTGEAGAPTIQQLNDPVIQTPNVSVFDFATGQSVNVARIEGGNPGLAADSRRIVKLGATLKPFSKSDLSLNATYTRTAIDDSVVSFPTITPDLEAAFPERFVRDAGGRLVSIDARPVSLARSERQELRWGLNYSRTFGRPTAAAGGAPGPGRPTATPGPGAPRPAGPGGPGGGMRTGPGGARPGQGALQFAVYHTWRIQDEVAIRAGLPTLDLLDGASLGGGGGQPRHEAQIQGGYFKDGVGLRLNGVWRGETLVRAGQTGGRDLFFSDQAVANLTLFADLSARQALIARRPWLSGVRLSLNVDNVFDSRQTVRDAQGLTPEAYQRDRLDPMGRGVRLSVRKLLR